MSGNGKVQQHARCGAPSRAIVAGRRFEAARPENWGMMRAQARRSASIWAAICPACQPNSGRRLLPTAKGDHFADAPFF